MMSWKRTKRWNKFASTAFSVCKTQFATGTRAADPLHVHDTREHEQNRMPGEKPFDVDGATS